jgi:tRNA (guanine6-N2)-methyltransferase
MPRKKHPRRSPPSQSAPARTVELEVAPGVEAYAREELLEKFHDRLVTPPVVIPGALRLAYSGNLGGLLSLQTIIAAYLLETFPIPRPKGFLGHQHFTQLNTMIDQVRALSNHDDAYTTVHINAAGSRSSVMVRLLDDLAEANALIADQDEGDLLIRLRPSADERNGWDALVRLSPRPNATRSWRVNNLPGALNASVARVMIRLSQPTPDDRVLNVACGSGTLAIERLLESDALSVMACDISPDALAAAEANIAAAGLTGRIDLRNYDATDLLVSSNSVDVLFSDLPFGNLTGSHEQNVRLYPELMREAARVVRRGGRAVIISHEIRLFEAVLRDTDKWKIVTDFQITLSGLHPRIYVLERT